jgi:hypothetical protein
VAAPQALPGAVNGRFSSISRLSPEAGRGFVHLAASLCLLLFDWRHWRRRFWWVLAPCLTLAFSTVYLRFHYVVDLLMGAVVALAGWWMPEKYEASTGSLQMLSSGLNNRQS